MLSGLVGAGVAAIGIAIYLFAGAGSGEPADGAVPAATASLTATATAVATPTAVPTAVATGPASPELTSLPGATEMPGQAPPSVPPPGPPTAARGSGTTPGPGETTHVVAEGESLTALALQYGLTVADLAARNGLAPDARLLVGDILVLPAVLATPTPLP